MGAVEFGDWKETKCWVEGVACSGGRGRVSDSTRE